MRILLDECVPSRLGRELAGHEVRTAPEMGWASQESGALLGLAEGQLDDSQGTDQRIRYQQALPKFAIALVVQVARRNKTEFLFRLLAELRRALGRVKTGQVYRVGVQLSAEADGGRRARGRLASQFACRGLTMRSTDHAGEGGVK